MSSLEPRILTVERRLKGAEIAYENLRRQIAALLQGMRDTEDSTAYTLCYRWWIVRALNCNFPTSGLTLTNVETGSSAIATSGTLSAFQEIAIGASPPAVTYHVQGANPPRLALTSGGAFTPTCSSPWANSNFSLFPNGEVDLNITAAAGYACIGSGAVPLKQSILMSDPNLGVSQAMTFVAAGGSVTITNPNVGTVSPGVNFWYATVAGTFGAGSGCPANTVNLAYVLVPPNLTVWYAGTGGGSCPGTSATTRFPVSFTMNSQPTNSSSLQTIGFTQASGASALYHGALPANLTIVEQ